MKKKLLMILFLAVIFKPIYSMEPFDDFGLWDDDIGEYSGLEMLWDSDSNEQASYDIKKILIEKIKDFEKDVVSGIRKIRPSTEGYFIARLYELVCEFITKEQRLKTKEFCSFLRQNEIDISYRSIDSFLTKFKSFDENKKSEIRVLVDGLLLEPLELELSGGEILIINAIRGFQQKRKDGERRTFIEVGLIIKLYEMKYGNISKKTKFKLRDFTVYLKKNEIEIKYENLKLILQYFRNLSEKNREQKRLAIDQYLYGSKRVKKLSGEEKSRIGEILQLEKSRIDEGRKIRSRQELTQIIKLYELKYGDITRKQKLKGRLFCDYLEENQILINYETLIWHLAKAKKITKKKDIVLELGTVEVTILNKIREVDSAIVNKKIAGRIGQNIRNGLFVKWYEICNGKITEGVKLDTKIFIRRLREIGYLKDQDIKKMAVRLSGALTRFKKMAEDKKEKRRAETDKYLRTNKELIK